MLLSLAGDLKLGQLTFFVVVVVFVCCLFVCFFFFFLFCLFFLLLLFFSFFFGGGGGVTAVKSLYKLYMYVGVLTYISLASLLWDIGE